MSDRAWTQPEWWGPPPGWVGGLLPVGPIVARNDRGAVLAEELSVYPTGIAVTVEALLRPRRRADRDPAPPRDPRRDRTSPKLGAHIVELDDDELVRRVSLPTDSVELGVELRDGRQASTLEPVGGPGDFSILAFQEGEDVAPDPESNVVFMGGGGAAGPDFMRQSRFIWPLPSEGFRIFASWADVGLEKRSITVDGAAVRAALRQATEAWPDAAS